MKALTLHQPWASLVSLGVKSIETRSWSTKHRGPLVIHAGAKSPAVPSDGGWIGAYNLGRWTAEMVHADPCDCDEHLETRSWSTSYRGRLLIHAGAATPQTARTTRRESAADGVQMEH